MAYIPTLWANDTEPAINANNLNHIEQGIVATENLAIGIGTEGVKSTILENGTQKIINFVIISQANYDILTPDAATVYGII